MQASRESTPMSLQVTDGSQIDISLAQIVLESYLPPTKIKRSYKCTQCGHQTFNPRIHLRHRIAVHGDKIKIVECPLCVYACQYRQKLNRHLKLVHRRPAQQSFSTASANAANMASLQYGYSRLVNGDNSDSYNLNHLLNSVAYAQNFNGSTRLPNIDYTQIQQEPLNLSIKIKEDHNGIGDLAPTDDKTQ